jgi:rhodanese-related sulfurtransferase
MHGNSLSIATTDLFACLGKASAPILVDVRRQDEFEANDRLIIGASRYAPEQVDSWSRALSSSRSVVAYCSHGGEVSQRVATALRNAGMKATYLEGGLSAWSQKDLPTRKRLSAGEKNWITREHPKIDRIACPWLVSRFINPNAEFIYVPLDKVVSTAKELDAVPYDITGTEFGHVDDRCSFDAIVRIFDIMDPALDDVATVVRGADTSRRNLAPQCEGLYAISFGLSANFPDDHEMLRHGLVIYDALYTWCRKSRATNPRPTSAPATTSDRVNWLALGERDPTLDS